MQQSPLSAVVVRATQLATTSTLDAAATPVQHPAHCSQQEQDAWAAAVGSATQPATTSTLQDAAAAPTQHPAHCSQQEQDAWAAAVGSATQPATTSTFLDAAAAPMQHPAHCSQQEQDAWAAALSTRPASPQLRGTSHVLGPVAAIDCGSHCTRLLISAHGSELVGLALGRWL
jgi:hypothetical protein